MDEGGDVGEFDEEGGVVGAAREVEGGGGFEGREVSGEEGELSL